MEIHMKKLKLLGLTTALVLAGVTVWAETADPFADIVETRHGLMMQMAADVGKMGAMVKGDAPYDAATAARAAANVVAIASVISLDQFPAGSEQGKSADSSAKPELWATPDDFLAKLGDLNTAAEALKTAAATNPDALKSGISALGKACGACHSAYRASQG